MPPRCRDAEIFDSFLLPGCDERPESFGIADQFQRLGNAVPPTMIFTVTRQRGSIRSKDSPFVAVESLAAVAYRIRAEIALDSDADPVLAPLAQLADLA